MAGAVSCRIAQTRRERAPQIRARKQLYEKEAKSSFEFIAKDANPKKVPTRLLFGGKLEQMPLRTAVILAYEAYKRFQEPDKPERKPWQILKAKDCFGSRRQGQMGELVQSLEEIIKNITESEGQSTQKTSASGYSASRYSLACEPAGNGITRIGKGPW
ncbi:hypothetical protein ACNJYD_10050 [Bradyrhizobium sp. DASA03005]|uniref:hypothetical protein n=1 Tax=Bradyrhizobium sp. SPXBL-02 TaxID=3395912 RepID=UPI003F70675D